MKLNLWAARIALSLLVVACFSDASANTPFALEPARVQHYLMVTPTPETLYHWTTESALLELQRNRRGADALGLKPIVRDLRGELPIVTETLPVLQHKMGIFLSANPVPGVGYNAGELYVRNDAVTHSPPLLLILKMKPNLKRVIVSTSDIGAPFVIGDPAHADIVHHVYIDNMGVAMQEWILLNPAAVESATADPVQTRPVLIEKLREIQSGDLRNSVVERHSTMSLDEAARVSQRVLQSWDQQIDRVSAAVPALFRARIRTCENLF